MDLQGRVWVKNGADKRHVTAREEMQRMFQASGLLQADQVPVRVCPGPTSTNAPSPVTFERRYKQSPEQTDLALPALFENLKLATDGVPNLAGMLLFGKNPERHLHVCMIAAVCFPGTKTVGQPLPRQRKHTRYPGGAIPARPGLHQAQPAPCAGQPGLQ
jgi:ATP-dependent DNA helicase RecG